MPGLPIPKSPTKTRGKGKGKGKDKGKRKQKEKLKGIDPIYNNINNTLIWKRIYPDPDYEETIPEKPKRGKPILKKGNKNGTTPKGPPPQGPPPIDSCIPGRPPPRGVKTVPGTAYCSN